MNPHYHHQRNISLNFKSLRTRFALRFLRALKKIHNQQKPNGKNANFIATNKKYHKVKVAADVSMAAAVRPRRAWSRAMLARIRHRRVVCSRGKRAPSGFQQGQAEELRRLVPGGEAMELKTLLNETAHYIQCLTTQVTVMRNIVNYCSTS